jgi:hypothetical protein
MNKTTSELSLRFLEAANKVCPSMYRLAKEIPVITQQKLTNIKNGRNKPSETILKAFLEKYTQVSSVWLLTGEGKMLKTSHIGHTTSGDNSPIEGDITVTECRGELEKAMTKIAHLEEIMKGKDTKITELKDQIAELKVLFEQRLKDKEEIIELLKNK